LVFWVGGRAGGELLGGEFDGGEEVGGGGTAAGFGEDGADDFDELELEEVEVEEVVVVEDLGVRRDVSIVLANVLGWTQCGLFFSIILRTEVVSTISITPKSGSEWCMKLI